MCPACHRKLAWWENIPLFSFIALGGRCLVCKNTISRQYPIVEFSMGIVRRRGVVARQSIRVYHAGVGARLGAGFCIGFCFLYDLIMARF